MAMRDHANLKDIAIPPEQEAIMNIFCDAWEECRESECPNCPDRPKKIMSLMECFSLKFSRKLIEAGYAPVVRCKDCKHLETVIDMIGNMYCFCGNADGKYITEVDLEDFCSHGERKEV